MVILSFLQKVTKTRTPTATAEPAIEFKSVKGQRSVRTASSLPTTTTRTRCFQVWKYTAIRVSKTNDPAKQEGVVYRIPCLHRRDRKINARQNKGAQQRHPNSPYPDLCRFRARPRRCCGRPTTPDTNRFGMRLSLLIVILIGTPARSKRQSTQDFTLTTSTGTVE